MLVTMSFLRTLWQFTRPYALAVLWLHAAVIYSYFHTTTLSLADAFVGGLVILFSYMNAASINDISDQDTDKINLRTAQQKGNRPLLNKTATSRQVWWVVIVSSLGVLAGSCYVSMWLGVVGGVMLILNAIYSLPPIRVSGRGMLAQVLLPIMYVMFPSLVAVAVADVALDNTTVLLIIGLYAMFVGRLFLKDVRDEKGDAATGKRTYLVRHGLRKTMIQSGLWIAFGMAASIAAAVQVSREPYSVVVAGLATLIGCILCLVLCYRESYLDRQLLWIASIGRCASMWVAFLLIVGTSETYALPSGQRAFLLFITIAVFAAGIGMLIEAMPSKKQVSAAGRQQ